jgi:phospholipid/cholesterol/gamma-HCH transport system substrate-binding protein
MKITGTASKFGAFSLVLLAFTALIVVVFGQVRFDQTKRYSAVFSNASSLRAGQFVRASGVEVGKVAKVQLIDGDHRVLVDFDVDRSLEMFESTSADIRYQNLIGERYLELTRGDSQKRLPPGSTIPIERTHPALDLDALIGGFRPLFRALEPAKVNAIAQSIITVFQGEGGTIDDILDQTAEFTSTLADRDEVIGQIVNNLNSVLGTAVKHQNELDQTVNNFETLVTALRDKADPLATSVAHLSNAAGTVADLLADNRPLLHDSVGYLQIIAQPLIDQAAELDKLLTKLPETYRIIGRTGGLYGDFFNFYLCDVAIKINGLQPGGPVRTVKVFAHPTGRCTPQ